MPSHEDRAREALACDFIKECADVDEATRKNRTEQCGDCPCSFRPAMVAALEAVEAEHKAGMPLGKGPWVLAAAVESVEKKLRETEAEYAEWRNQSIKAGWEHERVVAEWRELAQKLAAGIRCVYFYPGRCDDDEPCNPCRILAAAREKGISV